MFVVGICFFFQAEDGIRDLVRSRGLGDVYKRQIQVGTDTITVTTTGGIQLQSTLRVTEIQYHAADPVSYTHLTLPTNYSV